MQNNLEIKKTSLSTTADVANTLDWKLSKLNEANLNIQEGLADYIGLSVDEIENSLQQLKSVKAEISSREKQLKEQKLFILEGAAQFLLSQGIDRMDGNIVSSVTITKGRAAGAKRKFTLLVPKAESEVFLIDAGLAVMEQVEVSATNDTLKINRRKVITPEIE